MPGDTGENTIKMCLQ